MFQYLEYVLKTGILYGSILILTSCSVMKQQETNDTAYATKYPVVLVHGFAFRDDIKIRKYWRNIPEALEKKGAQVFLSNTNAFNTHQNNASQLKERILDIIIREQCSKVNIIAHSKGGLEARYMITKLDMDNRVASLTTVSTPHRGAALSGVIIDKLIDYNLLQTAKNTAKRLGTLMGDKNPRVLLSGMQLTPAYMEKFNKEVPNRPNVYYQSYCGVISRNYPSFYERLKYWPLLKREGLHDGTVSLMSCKWGNFMGIIPSGDGYGVSHFEVIGQTNKTQFDANQFFIDVVKRLKRKGF